MSNPADLGVLDAAAALAGRSLSSRELVEACLARIHERDGVHSFDGDPGSVNAWVQTLLLEVRASNQAAVSLYQQAGFQQAGRRPNYYSDPVEDAALMRLTLG